MPFARLALTVLAWLSLAATSADYLAGGEFSFALSPKTNNHISVQPQPDHHRVYFLVRASGLKSMPCVATLRCWSPSDPFPTNLLSSTSAHFVPTEDDQVFAVYLRAPRLADKPGAYRIDIDVNRSVAPDFVLRQRGIYQWTIERDDRGEAKIAALAPGKTALLAEGVAKVIPESIEGSDGVVTETFRIVAEKEVVEVSIPADFRFGVDNNHAHEAAPYVVRPLK